MPLCVCVFSELFFSFRKWLSHGLLHLQPSTLPVKQNPPSFHSPPRSALCQQFNSFKWFSDCSIRAVRPFSLLLWGGNNQTLFCKTMMMIVTILNCGFKYANQTNFKAKEKEINKFLFYLVYLRMHTLLQADIVSFAIQIYICTLFLCSCWQLIVYILCISVKFLFNFPCLRAW